MGGVILCNPRDNYPYSLRLEKKYHLVLYSVGGVLSNVGVLSSVVHGSVVYSVLRTGR